MSDPRGYYSTRVISPELRPALRDLVNTKFDEMMTSVEPDLAAKTAEAKKIRTEQSTLVDAHLAGAVPLDVLKEKQFALQERYEIVQAEIAVLSSDYSDARKFMDDALWLIGNPQELYDRSNPDTRRRANQVFFRKLYIDAGRAARELVRSTEAKEDVDERSEEHIVETVTGRPPKPEHHVESISEYPFGILYDPKVQAEALAMMENPDYPRFKSDTGSVAQCFSLTHLGYSVATLPITLNRSSEE